LYTPTASSSSSSSSCFSFSTSSELTKTIAQQLLHLTAAEALNKEYQAKLHEDDTQLHRLSGLLNHWERKCDSQAKEIQRLAEREQTAAAALEQCTARSALLYQHIEDMQLQEGEVINVRKPAEP
jgi:hypothetical protein